jgi:uncharacterized protein involved in exopolysaccharide biosynthesis
MQYLTFDDIAEVLRRRLALILSIMATGLSVTAVLCLFVSPQYRAEEILGVAAPKVVTELALRDRVVPLAHDLPRLRDQLLARDTLDDIAVAYELPAGAALARAVALDWDTGQGGAGGITISVTLPDPLQAQLVAQELSHRLIRLSARDRIDGAERTLAYLTGEQQAVQTMLAGLAQSARSEPALSDDLRRMRAELEELTQRAGHAEAVFDLEARRQLERFVVIAPAELPDTPVRDVRPLLAMLGGGLGAVVAVAVALLLEVRRPALRTAARMQRLTGHAPLAVIPRAGADAGGNRRRRAWRSIVKWPLRRFWAFLI